MVGNGNDLHTAVSAVLRPRSAVVIGASAKRRGSGNFALANLAAAPGGPDVFVVHPSAKHIEGLAVTPTVADLPRGLDVALVSLPPAGIVPVLENLAQQGCRAAIVPTAGLGPHETTALRAFALASDMAVHGPNCMGTINVSDDIACWFYEDTLTAQRKGPIALVSQSGSAAFLTRALEGVGVSKVISSGNELGLTMADYLGWLADDPATSTVGLVIESLRDVPGFVTAVAAMRSAGKRVVALKVGRTQLGSAAARAHTGALAGSDAGYASLFERLDVPLVADYDELAVALQVLATPGMPASRGRRLAVVTDSGGESGLAADLSVGHAIELPGFTAATTATLAEVLPGAELGNPLDAGASPGAPDDAYYRVYSTVLEDARVDALLVLVEGHHTMSHGELHYSTELADALRRIAGSSPAKPVVVASSSSTATHPELAAWLSPIPLVRGIGNAFTALGALAGNRQVVPPPPTRPEDLPSVAIVDQLRREVRSCSGVVPAALTARLLDSYGVAFVASAVIASAAEAVDWADGRYPVVLKVVSPDIAHRSDVGGVAVDLRTSAEVEEAARRILLDVARNAPGAQITGLEIQAMVPRGVEALVGSTSDPVFGALLTVGSGGTLVELEADVVSAGAPITRDQAVDMVGRTRLGRRLAGYRNLMPPTSLDELAGIVVRLSWLAHDFAGILAAVDLNPVVVEPGSGRSTLVDALMIVADDLDATQVEPQPAGASR